MRWKIATGRCDRRRRSCWTRVPRRVAHRRSPHPPAWPARRSSPGRRSRSDGGAQSAAAKRGRSFSKDSMHLPAPRATHSRGVSTRWTGTAVPSARRWFMPPQERPPADQVDALEDDVLGQLRWRLAQAGDRRLDDLGHVLLDRRPDLFGREQDGLGHAGDDLAPSHLGVLLALVGVGRADGQLDGLGRAHRRWPPRGRCGRRSGCRRPGRSPHNGWPAWPPPPPREMTAVSAVPPPTSTTMLPMGSWVASPAPMAAAMGCSIR